MAAASMENPMNAGAFYPAKNTQTRYHEDGRNRRTRDLR
jgi:hypothetical protein